jgi:hypothetical protein
MTVIEQCFNSFVRSNNLISLLLCIKIRRPLQHLIKNYVMYSTDRTQPARKRTSSGSIANLLGSLWVRSGFAMAHPERTQIGPRANPELTQCKSRSDSGRTQSGPRANAKSEPALSLASQASGRGFAIYSPSAESQI